jgi:hypothetical protein
MADNVEPQLQVRLAHRKAESACHGAPLDRVQDGADEFTCRQCGQPTTRVLGEPTEVVANG